MPLNISLLFTWRTPGMEVLPRGVQWHATCYFRATCVQPETRSCNRNYLATVDAKKDSPTYSWEGSYPSRATLRSSADRLLHDLRHRQKTRPTIELCDSHRISFPLP